MERLPIGLFLLRVSVFLVMFMWTLDKFIRPDHAMLVYEKFYYIGFLNDMIMYIVGGLELAIIIGFLLGIQKTITYGFVLVFHTISTFSTYSQYFTPFEGLNLLFFAAWPMLAACGVLFYMRDLDTMFTLGK